VLTCLLMCRVVSLQAVRLGSWLQDAETEVVATASRLSEIKTVASKVSRNLVKLIGSFGCWRVPFWDEQRSLVVGASPVKQCHSCCEQTCLHAPSSPWQKARARGGLTAAQSGHGRHLQEPPFKLGRNPTQLGKRLTPLALLLPLLLLLL
jgi:hypothetical protein